MYRTNDGLRAMIGDLIGHYRILSKLGQGGMGEVFVAYDERLERKVALKVLPKDFASDSSQVDRFVREARTLAALNHPNIVTIHSVEEAEGLHFLTMELVAGKTLAQSLEGGQLSEARSCELALPLVEGLSAAHEKKIVHGDLKPGNVIVTGADVVKVVDFGLSRVAETDPQPTDEELADTATEVATIQGTVPYMSPEQLQGTAVDHRTDIYSLGVMLFEMVVGERPFKGRSSMALAISILRDAAPSIDDREGISARYATLVDTCLQKDPGRRPQSALEVAAELRGISEPPEVSGDSSALSSLSSSSVFTVDTSPSIAVLAFDDLSPETDQEYFCDGLAEELINALTKITGLRVVARTSAFSFKGQERDIRDIGRALNVRALLQGSVRKAGSRLRITAQLINAVDGFHLWSERFDRNLDDVFAIQDEITEAIVAKLELELLSRERALVRRHTTDIEAYHLYLKGRHLWNKRSPANLEAGIRFFEQALERDPRYALAQVGLADSYTILGYYSAMSPREAFPKAQKAAQQALELDDGLAEAHCALAFGSLLFDWNWQAAQQGFERTIELNPGYATARHWYAEYLALMGERERALDEARRALELDPLSLIINTLVGWVHYYTRDWEQAIESLSQTLALDPDFAPALFWSGLALERSGELERAEQALRSALSSSNESAMMKAALGAFCAAHGREQEADEILAELLARAEETFVPPYYVAALYHSKGELDTAFEWLDRSYQERDNWTVFLNVDPLWDASRDDRRFEQRLRRVGFTDS